MKEKIINFLKLVIAFLLFFNISSLILVIIKKFNIDTSVFDLKDVGYIDTLVELIFAIIITLLYHKYFFEDYVDLKNNYKKIFNSIFMFIALFFGIKIVSALVTGFMATITGIDIGESENQSAIVSITAGAPIMMLISTAILAPIVEEGIFRLGLRKVITNKYLFILASGLIFGFMHIFPTDLSLSVALIYSITYVTMGAYLAYIYEETDNIWIPIIIHATNNLLSMVAILIMS